MGWASSFLIREGHRFFERTKIFQINEIFCEKGVVQKNKRTMDERSGSFREMNKLFFFKKLFLALYSIVILFNFCSNFGISEQGEMVLADIGELRTTSAQIKQQIKLRVWAKWYVLNKLPRNLNTYFIEQMDQHILPLAETL